MTPRVPPKLKDRQRIEELWRDNVDRLSEFQKRSARRISSSRQRAAMHWLRVIPRLARRLKPDELEKRLLFAAHAFRIWRLLASELGGPVLEALMEPMGTQVKAILDHLEKTDAIQRRVLLIGALRWQEATMSPLHTHAIDPVAVMLPRALLQELIESLEALGAGEVLPLMEPVKQGTRSRVWTRTQVRMQVLAHVHFLVGRGLPKKRAEWRVHEATGIPEMTIHDWGIGLSAAERDRLKVSEGAGRLSVRLEGDPDFGSRPGESIDAHEMTDLEAFRNQSLKEFGAAYRERFKQH